MPVLKPVTGRTLSLAKARAYFEGKDGSRALAKDFVNLRERDERGRGWDEQMDELREAAGNNAYTYKGRRVVTYKHYVLSPDSRDAVTLEQLRELALAWAERYFSDYQVAIVYHDDNEARIMHAHIIVNNTSLADGHRLSSDLTKRRVLQMNNALQEMALERGLAGFSADHISLTEREMASMGKNVSRLGGDPEWRDRASGKAPATPPRPSRASTRGRRRDKSQAGLEARGVTSWKAEICGCCDVARRLATSERAFVAALGAMGVGVSVNKKGDFVYAHPDGGARRVRGERLGPAYTRQAVKTGVAVGYARWLKRAKGAAQTVPRLNDAQVELVARSVTVVGRAEKGRFSAAQVCDLLDYNAEHGVASYDGYGEGAEAARMREMARALGMFDAAVAERARRTRDDVAIVGKWIQQDRTEAGAGGFEYGSPGRGSEGARRRRGAGPGDGGDRGRGPRGR